MLIYEEDENSQPYVPTDPSYVLNGYFKRGDLLPNYLDFTLPRTKQKEKENYNILLAVQYFFYRYKNKMDEHDAVGYSHLKNPLPPDLQYYNFWRASACLSRLYNSVRHKCYFLTSGL
jgi:hypothetical protein